MTPWRQLQANRLDALKSIWPTTEEGKRISSRNALRHGLTAETVIDGLEDGEDYRGFEAAIIADYNAERQRRVRAAWSIKCRLVEASRSDHASAWISPTPVIFSPPNAQPAFHASID
jgi:hypothetical protein